MPRKQLGKAAAGSTDLMRLADVQALSNNHLFTGSATLPAISLLLPTTLTLVVTPVVAGDSLAAGAFIQVMPGAALPSGLNIAYAIVTATNTVQIGLSSTVTLAIGAGAVAWTVCNPR